MTSAEPETVVFVIDVTSFTKFGFIGTSKFGDKKVDIEFDDGSKGLTLPRDICKKIGARAGSNLLIISENEERPQVSESILSAVDERLRISDAKTYYFVGKLGGAIIRIRKK